MKRYSLGDYPYRLAKTIAWDTVEMFVIDSKAKWEKYRDVIKDAIAYRLWRAKIMVDEAEKAMEREEVETELDIAHHEFLADVYKYALAVLGWKGIKDVKKDPYTFFSCMRALLYNAALELNRVWSELEEHMKTVK
jgi:hypothetical protein